MSYPLRLLGYDITACDDEGLHDSLRKGDAHVRYSHVVQAASNAVSSLTEDGMAVHSLQISKGRVRAIAASNWIEY